MAKENEWWSADVAAASKPTPQERKSDVDLRGSTASAERTETLTPLDAEGVFLQNQERRRKLGLPVLTPAQEQADKKFADEYVAWRNTGGMPTLNRQLDQLQDALIILRTNDTITGPVLGRMPKWIQQLVDPQGPDVKAQVEDVIQRSLRQILGAQFTQVEGERMISRAFDPEQQEQSNIGRLTRVIDELRGQGAAKEASSRFFEKTGTLQGYTQQEADKVLKEYSTGSVPTGGQRWLSDQQEAVVNAYANGPNPTAQGYADLLTKFAQEQGLQPDAAWRQSAKEAGAQVEKHREAGGAFTKEGVQYLGGIPKPEEGDRTDVVAAAPLSGDGGGGGGGPDGDGLSWGEAATSAAARFLPNLAEVGIDTLQGLAQVITSPIETAQSVGELGSSILGAMGVTDADPAQAEAISNYLADRYGGIENIKRTFANEPASLLFDLSALLTAGGTAGVKLAGGAGRIASASNKVATAGRIIDPLSATVGGAEWLADATRRYLPEKVQRGAGRAFEGITQTVPAALAGFPSGVGPETIIEAAGAGRSSGRKLGSTPRSEAFRGQQVGGASAVNIINDLDAATKRLYDQASTRYQTEIAPITSDKTVLNLDDVDRKLDAIKPAGLGRYKTNRTPGSHAAWTEGRNLVDQHKVLMAQDPATYGTPAALDAFRRELYETLQGYAEGGDKGASRIANGLYYAVRDTIAKQAPDYDKTLKAYSAAQDQLDQINRSLKAGKSIDTSVRKMQNILKRTDTGFAGEMLEAADETGTIRTQLAGRSGSPYLPDRFRGAIFGAQSLAGAASMLPEGLLNAIPSMAENLTPAYIAGAAAMSPRVATSGAYRFGQGVGAAERAGAELYDLYQKYPALASVGVAGVSGAEQIGEELTLDELMRRYGAR